jgi:glutathione S-transferase
LRFFLSEVEPSFEDDRISLSGFPASWRDIKSDPERTGIFASLPVLQCGKEQVCQALVIADFLARRHRQLPEDESHRLRLQMVASAAQLDIVDVSAQLFYQPADEGLAAHERIQRYLARVRERAQQFERLLGSADFFGGARPVFADYFVFDALLELRDIFGEQVATVVRNCARLERFYERVAVLPGIARSLQVLPSRTTASGYEPAVRAALRAAAKNL